MFKKIILPISLLTLIVTPFTISPKTDKANALSVLSNEVLDTSNAFYDDFNDGIDKSSWFISKRVWGEVSGRTNGGVIPENVFYDSASESVKIRALGNQYAKNEVSGVGSITDGSCTGGALISKFTVTPGRYEIRMKVAPRVGVCTAMWIYNEDENGINHEIDFEVPGKTANDQNSFNQLLCSNYVGNITTKNHTLSYSLADGEYHTFTFDWYCSANNKLINYYVDGVLVQTATRNIPFYENRVWIGAWIPNNEGFVGLPNFDQTMMEVDYFGFTPFKNQTYTQDDCYVSSGQVASNSQYPMSTDGVDFTNMYPNGDFEYVTKRGANYAYSGLNYMGNYTFIDNGAYSKSLSLTNGSVSADIDTTIENKTYEASLSYKGQGTLVANFYDINGNLFDEQVLTLPSKDNMTFIDNLDIEMPKNTFKTNLTISTDTNIVLDDISFKLGSGSETPDVVPTNSSYGVNLINNNNIPSDGYRYLKNQSIAFDGNNDHKWLVSSYQKLERDNIMRLGFYSEDDDATLPQSENASIGNYTGSDNISRTYKQLYANAISKNDPATFFVQAIVMEYDIDYFNNIAFYFNDLNAENWQALMIHYSIDSGNTWNYLNHHYAKDAMDKGTNNIDISSVKANNAMLDGVSYDKIRFALTTTYYGNMNSQVILMSGIVINNFDDFKNKIDGNTCSYTSEDIDLLNVLFASLNESEKALTKKNMLTSYNKTYFEAYNEIIDRYSAGSGLNEFIQNTRTLELVIIIASAIGIICLFVLLKYFKNRKGGYLND